MIEHFFPGLSEGEARDVISRATNHQVLSIYANAGGVQVQVSDHLSDDQVRAIDALTDYAAGRK